MSFTMDIYNLLIRYTKDSEGKDISLKELQNIELWRCIWGWWRAKAFYQIDGYYQRLEDVPEGLEDYIIQTDELNIKYGTFNGSKYVQQMTRADCKSIYGS